MSPRHKMDAGRVSFDVMLEAARGRVARSQAERDKGLAADSVNQERAAAIASSQAMLEDIAAEVANLRQQQAELQVALVNLQDQQPRYAGLSAQVTQDYVGFLDLIEPLHADMEAAANGTDDERAVALAAWLAGVAAAERMYF